MKNRLYPAIGLKGACESYSDVIIRVARGGAEAEHRDGKYRVPA
jgi:hypothetical protein